MNNETIPYVTRNLRHLLVAPNLTEAQRTIITRTLATLSEEVNRPSIDDMLADESFMRKVDEVTRNYADKILRKSSELTIEGGR